MSVQDWTDNPYPLARKKRTGPPPTGTPAGTVAVAVPRARYITFASRDTLAAGEAISMCSSRIVGPAFIDEFYPTTASSNQFEAWRLYISNDEGHRASKAAGMNLETGDIIFETAMRAGVVGSAVTSNALLTSHIAAIAGGGGRPSPYKIGQLVQRAEFFLKVQVLSIGASYNPWANVRIVENIPIELFPDFLAS